jgi:predicted lipoprotein
MQTQRLTSRTRLLLTVGAAIVLVAAMALDTKVVAVGSSADATPGAFSQEAYGKSEFPKVRTAVEAKAVDAATLAAAIAKDPDAAQKQYGVAADAGPEFAVKFTGTVGKKDEDSGLYPVAVAGLPDTVHVALQLGPAIIGTDLRDSTGLIAFGQFRNQIDYQNAGAALNDAMKASVVSKLDVATLPGKTVSVVGVFQLTDPTTWPVIPVAVTVQ